MNEKEQSLKSVGCCKNFENLNSVNRYLLINEIMSNKKKPIIRLTKNIGKEDKK